MESLWVYKLHPCPSVDELNGILGDFYFCLIIFGAFFPFLFFWFLNHTGILLIYDGVQFCVFYFLFVLFYSELVFLSGGWEGVELEGSGSGRIWRRWRKKNYNEKIYEKTLTFNKKYIKLKKEKKRIIRYEGTRLVLGRLKKDLKFQAKLIYLVKACFKQATQSITIPWNPVSKYCYCKSV